MRWPKYWSFKANGANYGGFGGNGSANDNGGNNNDDVVDADFKTK